jgi:uncharacterized protein YhfF
VIFRPELARQIRNGQKTMTRRLVENGEPCRYRPGKHYAVQPGRGQAAVCRIAIESVRQERVGDITFADARAEGFQTTEEFKAYWVAIHDKAWLAVENAMLDSADNDEDVVLDRDVWILRRSLIRFAEENNVRKVSHANKIVWVISFSLLVMEEPRFLGASSPLVDGGKARLMSARKVKPGPARQTRNPEAMTEDEATGYVRAPARGLALEAEPVSREIQKRITADAGMTTRQWQAVEAAHRDRDRELLSREDQIVRLQRAARLRGTGPAIRNELRLLEGMRVTATEEAFTRKVRKAEQRVFGVAA